MANCIYVFFRLAPLLVVAPLGYLRIVPILVRVTISVLLAIVIALGLEMADASKPEGLVVATMLSELMLGTALSLSFHLVSGALHFFGQLIDTQIGFAAASVFDPSTKQSTGILSTLIGVSFGALFFLGDLHYVLLSAFKLIYAYVPIGTQFELQSNWYSIAGKIFAVGFILASPVIFIILVLDVALALISRSLPQAPMYFVGLPLKVMLGIIALSWHVQTLAKPLLEFFLQGVHSWNLLLKV